MLNDAKWCSMMLNDTWGHLGTLCETWKLLKYNYRQTKKQRDNAKWVTIATEKLPRIHVY